MAYPQIERLNALVKSRLPTSATAPGLFFLSRQYRMPYRRHNLRDDSVPERRYAFSSVASTFVHCSG